MHIANHLRTKDIFKKKTNRGYLYDTRPFPEDYPFVSSKKQLLPYIHRYLEHHGTGTAKQMLDYGFDHNLFGGRMNINTNIISKMILQDPEITTTGKVNHKFWAGVYRKGTLYTLKNNEDEVMASDTN